jgi:hypothetical protein
MDADVGKKVLSDDQRLASYLSGLLHKVLHYHDVDALPQIVLHEIGHDHSFALSKATYLVDNPDFNHLSGVAGYDNCECGLHHEDMWKDPYSFAKDMKEAQYHNNVRAFLNDSLKRKDVNLNDASEVKDLGKLLGLQNPEFFAWSMKHGNHGLLLFEKKEMDENPWKKDLLRNVSALLSFCGI